LPQPVTVEGTVLGRSSEGDSSTASPPGAGQRATVNFVAKKLTGIGDGVLVLFRRSVETDEEGLFSVALLPGEYDVVAVPSMSTGYAATTTPPDTPWHINTEVKQGGKSIVLDLTSTIEGEVVAFDNRQLIGAPVQVSASPAEFSASVFDRALGAVPFVPRASVTLSSESGRFGVNVDPGVFELAVRPSTDTGFAWLVLPRVDAPREGERDLGRLKMPLPVVHSGLVRIAGTEAGIGNALIRAYAYVDGDGRVTADADSTKDKSLIQVAESRADTDGRFQLLLPSSLQEP
jgi:hypothetical protein